ncbi:hypothetical protein II906_09450 [bacterium]|nr:hypothetical protein [bacterium]
MNKQIDNNFCGILQYNYGTEVDDLFFHVVDDLVTLLPATEESKKRIINSVKSKELKEKDNTKWLFGFAENGCSVAFFQHGKLNINFSFPIDLQPAKFRAPIILQSTTPSGIDLHTFNEIEFCNGVVDLLHFPSKAIEGRASDGSINFRDPKHYTRRFSVSVNGADFDVIFTVSLTDLVRELGKVPDLRRHIHSVLRFEFQSAQPIDTFETYYKYALRFFQFCVGRNNLDFNVKLYQRTEKQRFTILTRFVDGFDDYANDKLDCIHLIHFEDLNNKFPKLFSVLNEEERQPNFLFLPKRNKEIGYVYYTNITDLCVSLDKEYNYIKSELLDNNKKQAQELSKELNLFIEKSNYPQKVKEKAKALNCGALANMQPSLKEKIIALYDDFAVQLNEVSNCKYHDYDNSTTVKEYSDDDFKRLIGKFVQIRNSAAHTGIIWNEGIQIYQHLQLLMYFCVLKRAGYTLEESKKILFNLFKWRFL